MANGTIRGELADGVIEFDDMLEGIHVGYEDDLIILTIITETGSLEMELPRREATHLASSLVKKLKSKEE